MIKSVDTWAQPSVQTKDLPVHKCSQRQIIEQVGKILPDVGVPIFAEALVVKSVNLEKKFLGLKIKS